MQKEIIPTQSSVYTVEEVETNCVTSDAVSYSDKEAQQNVIFESKNLLVSIAPDKPIILANLKKNDQRFWSDSRISFTASIQSAREDKLITEKELLNCLDAIHREARHVQMINLDNDFE